MLHRWRSVPIWVGVLASLSSAILGAESGELERGIELIRDRWGIPHVFAASDDGAMYGLGYATAEDRGFQMHYSLRVIQGRLAETIGDVKKVRRRETALQNDRKMRTFGFYRAAQRIVANLDPETTRLLQAYSDGVNAYFKKQQGKLPKIFATVGLEPQPWTVADCIASWWHLAQFFGTDGTRDLIAYRRLVSGQGGRGGRRRAPRVEPDDQAAVVQRQDVTDEWLARARDFLRQQGAVPSSREESDGEKRVRFSHAWVVGGGRTTTGSAVLVSDPQTPVANPSLLYEFHLRGKTFDARGVGVPGSPVVLIGFTPHVAWGMTALGADQADLFRLETDPARPNAYRFDGEWREMEVLEESIYVKGERARRHRIRLTHLGPVVTEFAFAKPDEGEVALKRVPICDTDRETIQGAMAMIRAGSVDEFTKALAGWRFPSANVVYGDRDGQIGYHVVVALPFRSPLSANGGAAAHDGSQSKYDWREFVPHDLLPQVINPKRGYIYSANHRPIGSFYPISLGNATGSLGDTVRSWRLGERLGAKEKFTPEEVLEVHYDDVNPARRELVALGYHLRDVLKVELPQGASRALEHLESWRKEGSRSDLGLSGGALAGEIPTFFRIVRTDLALKYGGGLSGISRWLRSARRRLDKDPRAQLEPLEQEYVTSALAEAWESANRKYGADVERWPERARQQVEARRLGYYASLDGFPSLNHEHDVEVPSLSCVDGQTIRSQAAQAYTQFVPLDNVDRAQSILPIGNSERIGEPARLATLRMWAEGKLHPAPLSRQAVEAIAVTRVLLSP